VFAQPQSLGEEEEVEQSALRGTREMDDESNSTWLPEAGSDHTVVLFTPGKWAARWICLRSLPSRVMLAAPIVWRAIRAKRSRRRAGGCRGDHRSSGAGDPLQRRQSLGDLLGVADETASRSGPRRRRAARRSVPGSRRGRVGHRTAPPGSSTPVAVGAGEMSGRRAVVGDEDVGRDTTYGRGQLRRRMKAER